MTSAGSFKLFNLNGDSVQFARLACSTTNGLTVFFSRYIHEILKIVITAVLTSGLTYFLASRKDRRNRVYENNTKLLDDVYEPIMRIIEHSIVPMDGYDGLSTQAVNEIVNIIEEHSHIVDKKLNDFCWSFKEELYRIDFNNGGRYYSFDGKRKFLDYADHRRNKLKRKVNRPYDASAFKTRRFIRNNSYRIRLKVLFLLRRLDVLFKRKTN